MPLKSRRNSENAINKREGPLQSTFSTLVSLCRLVVFSRQREMRIERTNERTDKVNDAVAKKKEKEKKRKGKNARREKC